MLTKKFGTGVKAGCIVIGMLLVLMAATIGVFALLLMLAWNYISAQSGQPQINYPTALVIVVALYALQSFLRGIVAR